MMNVKKTGTKVFREGLYKVVFKQGVKEASHLGSREKHSRQNNLCKDFHRSEHIYLNNTGRHVWLKQNEQKGEAGNKYTGIAGG